MRRIIEAHGGTVSVQSEPGRGSTFTIDLPGVHDVRRRRRARRSATVNRRRRRARSGGSSRPADAHALRPPPARRRRARPATGAERSARSSEGYHVETAADGNTAVARATGEPFDLIMLDVMLPGRDGFDVARTVRQQGIQTPILMLTARGEVVDRVVGLKLGADDYLTKPFEMIELLARLEALLRRAPASAGVSLERYQFGDVLVDVRKAEVTRNGVARRSVGEGVSSAALLHRASRRDDLARRAAASGVGLSLDAVDAHGRCARRVAATEARTQSPRAAVHPHRARPRV